MLNTAPNYVQEYLWNVLHLAVASRSEKCVVFLMAYRGPTSLDAKSCREIYDCLCSMTSLNPFQKTYLEKSTLKSKTRKKVMH